MCRVLKLNNSKCPWQSKLFSIIIYAHQPWQILSLLGRTLWVVFNPKLNDQIWPGNLLWPINKMWMEVICATWAEALRAIMWFCHHSFPFATKLAYPNWGPLFQPWSCNEDKERRHLWWTWVGNNPIHLLVNQSDFRVISYHRIV